MKKTTNTRICIGEITNSHDRYVFDQAIDKLRTIITAEASAEYGEELTTEFLRTLLTNENAVRQRLADKCNAALLSCVFPAERRQKESVYTDLIISFDKWYGQIKGVISDFPYIPTDAYCVQAGVVDYDRDMVDAVFAEQSKVYIDSPQQIEVYEAAKTAFEALRNLDALSRKYGMYAVNKSNYRTIIDMDIDMDETMGVLRAEQVLRLNPFAIQQAHNGGLFKSNL